MKLNDNVISLIRTYVPIIVATVVTYLATVDIDIESEALETVLMPLAIGGYYLGARLLATIHPIFGWLLGYPSNPHYLPDDQA